MAEVLSAPCRLPRGPAGDAHIYGAEARLRSSPTLCLSNPHSAPAPPALPCWVLPALPCWSFSLPYPQHRQTVSPCLLA